MIVVAVLSSVATLMIEHRATGGSAAPTPVAFVISAPDAKSAFVTGSFNNWNITDHLMTKQADGRWTITLPLTPGRYQYKFVVDGEWMTDPANPIKVPVLAPATGYNSVIEVRPPTPPANP
jgi:1,4-alpha-glucan branching enzyme